MQVLAVGGFFFAKGLQKMQTITVCVGRENLLRKAF
jgi:hypothetical protein